MNSKKQAANSLVPLNSVVAVQHGYIVVAGTTELDSIAYVEYFLQRRRPTLVDVAASLRFELQYLVLERFQVIHLPVRQVKNKIQILVVLIEDETNISNIITPTRLGRAVGPRQTHTNKPVGDELHVDIRRFYVVFAQRLVRDVLWRERLSNRPLVLRYLLCRWRTGFVGGGECLLRVAPAREKPRHKHVKHAFPLFARWA